MRGHVIVGVMTISTDDDKLYDTDLTDAAWALIVPMLPAARPGAEPLHSPFNRGMVRVVIFCPPVR
jgi:hypothetical protein